MARLRVRALLVDRDAVPRPRGWWFPALGVVAIALFASCIVIEARPGGCHLRVLFDEYPLDLVLRNLNYLWCEVLVIVLLLRARGGYPFYVRSLWIGLLGFVTGFWLLLFSMCGDGARVGFALGHMLIAIWLLACPILAGVGVLARKLVRLVRAG